MLFISVILIVLFFVIDTIMFKREGGVVPDDGTNEPVRVEDFSTSSLVRYYRCRFLSGTFKWGEVNILGFMCIGKILRVKY